MQLNANFSQSHTKAVLFLCRNSVLNVKLLILTLRKIHESHLQSQDLFKPIVSSKHLGRLARSFGIKPFKTKNTFVLNRGSWRATANTAFRINTSPSFPRAATMLFFPQAFQRAGHCDFPAVACDGNGVSAYVSDFLVLPS